MYSTYCALPKKENKVSWNTVSLWVIFNFYLIGPNDRYHNLQYFLALQGLRYICEGLEYKRWGSQLLNSSPESFFEYSGILWKISKNCWKFQFFSTGPQRTNSSFQTGFRSTWCSVAERLEFSVGGWWLRLTPASMRV